MGQKQKHAFILAGTGSGCGKTTVALGLMCALRNKGLSVKPFKVGPDYLDSAWHTAISGTPSCNLDAFMLPALVVNQLFLTHLAEHDIAVIEGVMGLYDGYGHDPHYCSSAGLAKALGCPVILLVDGKAVSTSIAATVMGFQRFDPELTIAGVIINRVNSEHHYQLLRHAIEHYCKLPTLGYIGVNRDIALPERHLGLVTAKESLIDHVQWQHFAETTAANVDLDKLLQLTQYTMPENEVNSASITSAMGHGLTLALADDEAFNFYYPDNLTLLENAGINIVRFSPLHDTTLPPCQMIYLGGGYPEIHAATLSANPSMKHALREAHQRGVAIYAECGGLMYLGEAIVDAQGERHSMVGIFSGESRMSSRLQRFGYCEAKALEETLLAAKGEVVRGHEFHYSDFVTEVPTCMQLSKVRDGITVKQWQGGYQIGNTFASYLHVHFCQNDKLLSRWIASARGAQ